MLLTLLSAALASTPPGLPTMRPPCGTPGIVPTLGPAPRLPVGPPIPAAQKTAREPNGTTYPNELASENFVAKWGTRGGISEADAQDLLDAFEHAWATEIEAEGFPAPGGTDRYLFNVYIGDTGDGAPDGYGTSGYFNRDREGYPMIVVSAATLGDLAWAQGTAAHEFFHAVQDVTGRYDYTGDSAWYWEATAMWIEGEVLPDHDEYVAFLYGYALLPHLPVYFFDYPDSGALEEYHQYGAMIFPRYVSEIAADSELIRDSWVEPGADTPHDTIAELLAERGVAIEDAFGDFAARNVTWDYADGAVYDQWVDWYADYYRSEDARVVDELDADGTDGLVEAPDDTLPGRYGYNVVTLARPDEGDYRVRFEGAAEGSDGSAADWRVTVVQDLPGGPLYTPVALNAATGEILLEDVEDAPIHLVVAAVPERARTDETFAWSYSVAWEAPAGDDDTGLPEEPARPGLDDDESAGCGCASGGSAWMAGALVAAGLVARRRR